MSQSVRAAALRDSRARPADEGCDGRTLTRAELDATTNRLARAYQELGVGVGDYVTIVLPNSIEFLQATIACWKLGAVPQPLSSRLPEAELEGFLELRPRTLLSAARIRGAHRPVCQGVSHPIGDCPMRRCRRRSRRCGRRWPPAAARVGPS